MSTKTSSSSQNKKQSKILKKKKKDKARQKGAKEQRDIQKEIAKKMHAIEEMISRVPSSCNVCGEYFNNKDHDHLDKWNMSINNTQMVLTCENCRVTQDDSTQN